MIFPIIGLLTYSLLIALLAAAAVWWVDFRLERLWQAPPWIKLVALYLLYILGYMTTFSANTAMVGMTMRTFEGKQVTFIDGWRIALSNRKNILVYALFAATLGMALTLFSRWTGSLGKYALMIVRRVLIFSVLSLAWHVVPILIIPVLVTERLEPLAAVKYCSQLVTHTWGEGVVRYANLWNIFLIPLCGSIVIGIGSVIWAGYSAQELWLTTALFLFAMTVAILFLVASALSGIYSAIVYRYACALPVTPPFEEESVSKAFRARPSQTLHRLRDWP